MDKEVKIIDFRNVKEKEPKLINEDEKKYKNEIWNSENYLKSKHWKIEWIYENLEYFLNTK